MTEPPNDPPPKALSYADPKPAEVLWFRVLVWVLIAACGGVIAYVLVDWFRYR